VDSGAFAFSKLLSSQSSLSVGYILAGSSYPQQ
jgi:hypothetical protein